MYNLNSKFKSLLSIFILISCVQANCYNRTHKQYIDHLATLTQKNPKKKKQADSHLQKKKVPFNVVTQDYEYNVNIRSEMLDNFDLSQSKMTDINFISSVCRYSNFQSADLEHDIFFNCDLEGSDFSGAKLSNINFFSNNAFSRMNLKKSKFKKTVFKDVTFKDVSLKGADFSGAIFKGQIVFRNVDLTEVNFEGAIFVGTFIEFSNLIKANLKNTIFKASHFKDLKLIETNINHTYFSQTEFMMVDFTNSDINTAYFENLTFTGVNLENCRNKDKALFKNVQNKACPQILRMMRPLKLQSKL